MKYWLLLLLSRAKHIANYPSTTKLSNYVHVRLQSYTTTFIHFVESPRGILLTFICVCEAIVWRFILVFATRRTCRITGTIFELLTWPARICRVAWIERQNLWPSISLWSFACHEFVDLQIAVWQNQTLEIYKKNEWKWHKIHWRFQEFGITESQKGDEKIRLDQISEG